MFDLIIVGGGAAGFSAATFDHVTFTGGRGRILGAGRMEVNGETVEARNILVATGSRASIPPIPGLVEAGYMTNIEALQLD